MQILLINPVIREWSKPNCFPTGLGYLAKTLTLAGHDVEVLDLNALRLPSTEVSKEIESCNYDVVGIGGLITVYSEIKNLARICKEIHPDKLIMAGGSVSTSIPKTLLEKTQVDIACIGEGEITVVEIVNALHNNDPLEKVEGIWFKNQQGSLVANKSRPFVQDIDTIPFPRYDLFPTDIYLGNPIGYLNLKKWDDGVCDAPVERSINISSSRGCVFHCIYCYHDFMGARHRKRTALNIIQEIELLLEQYSPKYFHFIDDNFVVSRRNVFEFCSLIVERGLDITWGCAGRVNSMDESLLVAMKESGCRFITYGVESGSQRMLDVMKKDVKVEKVKEVLKLTMKHIGWPSPTFIVGTPGENKATIQETVDFCKELELCPEAIFFMTLYPGTELYRMALETGQLSLETEEDFVLSLGEQGEQLLVNFSELPDEELIEIKWRMAEELGAQNIKTHFPGENLAAHPRG